MERLCYRCNAPVAAGVPFCPQCNAPQIRVSSGTEQQEESPSHSSEVLPPPASSEANLHIHWSAALARTAVAAVATVAMLQLVNIVVHVPAFGFLVLPVGGWFAVYLYARRMPGRITAGMGARLGAVTGFFVFLILFCVSALGVLLDRQAVFDLLKKAMNDAAAANPNPQAAALMQQMQTPAGMMTLLLLASVMFLFMSLILCSVGGAAGAAVTKQDH